MGASGERLVLAMEKLLASTAGGRPAECAPLCLGIRALSPHIGGARERTLIRVREMEKNRAGGTFRPWGNAAGRSRDQEP